MEKGKKKCPVHLNAQVSAKIGSPWDFLDWSRAKRIKGCLGTNCDSCSERRKK